MGQESYDFRYLSGLDVKDSTDRDIKRVIYRSRNFNYECLVQGNHLHRKRLVVRVMNSDSNKGNLVLVKTDVGEVFRMPSILVRLSDLEEID